MEYRAKAPLRLGLAGGGTDVSPYSEKFGGCVLNATIDMYAYASLKPRNDGRVRFEAHDIDAHFEAPAVSRLAIEGPLKLHAAIYNRIVNEFNDGEPLPLTLTTYSDAPPGCGLGSSSTMVVSILAAYREYLNLPLGEYDLAHLAYEIERIDCQLSGGKQDQYTATFGGFNFMEFINNQVLVNPLRIRADIQNELESRLVLFFTGISRDSAKIIDDQIEAGKGEQKAVSLEGLHRVKESALHMKEALLKRNLDVMAEILAESWDAKKQTSSSISNPAVEDIANFAKGLGAHSFKLTGAGGGGFMLMFIDPTKKHIISKALDARQQGQVHRFRFTSEGVQSWTA